MTTGIQFPNWSTDPPEASRTLYNTFIRKQPMPTTFADYAAQQEARENIANAVLAHTLALCEALRHDFECKYERTGYEFYPETGRKYHKIVMDGNGSRSVHAFVDKKTGEVYKSASWKAPAKGVRYDLRIISQREWLLENADWAGGYLYAR
jgi:hypothetical protein